MEHGITAPCLGHWKQSKVLGVHSPSFPQLQPLRRKQAGKPLPGSPGIIYGQGSGMLDGSMVGVPGFKRERERERESVCVCVCACVCACDAGSSISSPIRSLEKDTKERECGRNDWRWTTQGVRVDGNGNNQGDGLYARCICVCVYLAPACMSDALAGRLPRPQAPSLPQKPCFGKLCHSLS
ncbi:hypothetical protein LZ32DRAFT_381200 [Colletotrichum eremochloae]|nr:hypothetical protein LZ32DRAFT_381200 [Colletotrichum eremochloae]